MTGYYFKPIPMIACVLILSLAGPLAAAEISVGLGGAWQSSPYKGHDDRALPLPILAIEGERFYLRGPDLGMRVFKSELQTVSLGLFYGSMEFDSGDTDDARLKKLDDRDQTLNAYFQYALKGEYGRAGLRLFHDLLDHSGGWGGEVFYQYPFTAGPFQLSPGAGLTWDSEDQLAYYYGVSAKEARRSGLEQYRPEAGISPFLSLEADWNFTEQWSLTAGGRAWFLSQEIQDSPMVDEEQVFTTFIGLKYRVR